MNFKVPILTATAIIGFASVAQLQLAQPLIEDGVSDAIDGQELIARASNQMFHLPPLEAKVRQRANLFGFQLSGPGRYAQLGHGQAKAELLLTLGIGGHAARLQQCSNGRFLYTRQELPDGHRLSYVDLERVREAVKESKAANPSAIVTDLAAAGELSTLLAELDRYFSFGPARDEQIGEPPLPVWVVHGTWKPEQLAKLLPQQQDAIRSGAPVDLQSLPPHVPHGVSVTLSRDESFPLFPHRIAYLQLAQSHPSHFSESKPVMQPVLTLELFNVRYDPNMDAAKFEYEPGDEDLIDDTESYLLRLGT